MKRAIVTSIVLSVLAGCERQTTPSIGVPVTSFDAVEMVHLALRDSCDGRFQLKFTSALTEHAGRIARGGSYWIISSTNSPEQLEIAIVPPKTRDATLVVTKKGAVWISVLSQRDKAASFLKVWNMPTVEAWTHSLIENIRQQSEAESWESEVPSESGEASSER
jgi:hypothetical protein